MINKGDIINLSDNKEYVVMDLVIYKENKYSILVDLNEITNIFVGRLDNDQINEEKDPETLKAVLSLVDTKVE